MHPVDELIMLLHTASEIEHALMVQYLYAAYSLPDQLPQNNWRDTLVLIARQEMGHLLAMQNLLLAVGAPLNFEREDYPYREFYPFPVKLESVSLASLARYVLAEMPDPASVPEVDMSALLAQAGVQSVPRVGTLFHAIGKLIEEIAADPVLADSFPFQATPDEWNAEAYGLVLYQVRSLQEAAQLVAAIGRQGEGPDEASGGPLSHFRRFWGIYNEARQHVQEGNELADAVPVDPTVHHPEADGYLHNSIAREWGAIFNARYRLLLASLSHLLSFPSEGDEALQLRFWALSDMGALKDIAAVLKDQPQHEPLRVDAKGRPRMAAAPFELPYTLSPPGRAVDRWRQLRMLMAFHLDQLRLRQADDQHVSGWIADLDARIVDVSGRLENP
jgi:hypothetical protein